MISDLEHSDSPARPTQHILLADLAGDIRLQAACKDLVDDAVTVIGVIGLLTVVVTWV